MLKHGMTRDRPSRPLFVGSLSLVRGILWSLFGVIELGCFWDSTPGLLDSGRDGPKPSTRTMYDDIEPDTLPGSIGAQGVMSTGRLVVKYSDPAKTDISESTWLLCFH